MEEGPHLVVHQAAHCRHLPQLCEVDLQRVETISDLQLNFSGGSQRVPGGLAESREGVRGTRPSRRERMQLETPTGCASSRVLTRWMVARSLSFAPCPELPLARWLLRLCPIYVMPQFLSTIAVEILLQNTRNC